MTSSRDSFEDGANSYRGRYLPAFLVLLVIGVGVPVLELAEGVPQVAWRHTEVSGESLRSGAAARQWETELGNRSKLAAIVRPIYNEALYSLFREVTSKVVVGRDGWLFEASDCRNYPRPDAEATVARHIDAIARLSQWFEERDIAFLVVGVPPKWAIHGEYLPQLPSPPRSVLPEIVAGLSQRGVWHVDVKAALSGTEGFAYYPNDTHISPAGSQRLVSTVAQSIRKRFGERVPGDVVTVDWQASSQTSPHEGDLLKMLGFRRGSATYEALLIPTVRGWAKEVEKKRVAVLKGPQPIVWCGTSYSDVGRFAALLSAELDRIVEDLAVPAIGPMATLLELVDAMLADERPAPKLIVWEFPEKHVFVRQGEFIAPLEAFLREDRAGQAAAVQAYSVRAPMPGASRSTYQLSLDELAGGGLRGEPSSGDPQLLYRLESPLPADGSFALSWTLTTTRLTTSKVLFDFGKGITREHAASVVIRGNDRPQTVIVPIQGPPGSNVVGFRIDPVDDLLPFTMGPLELARRP